MAETKRRTPAIFDRQPGEYFPGPKVNAFVLFQQPPAPASPVIAYRTRVLSELVVEPRPVPPYFFALVPFTAAALASPVIPHRYGRDVLSAPAAFVAARFQSFPYFQGAAPAPASPVIPCIRGQWIGDAVVPLIGTGPRHLPFPYSTFPPPPANLVIPFLVRRLEELSVAPALTFSQFIYTPASLPPPEVVAGIVPVRTGWRRYKHTGFPRPGVC